MRRTPRSRRARPNLFLLEDRTAPATLTWTGDDNANWSTNVAGNTNWNTNLLPASGDDLIFPASGANHVNTNDLTGLSPNSIIFSGTDYVIGGNSVTILTGLTDGSTFGNNALNLPITVTEKKN